MSALLPYLYVPDAVAVRAAFDALYDRGYRRRSLSRNREQDWGFVNEDRRLGDSAPIYHGAGGDMPTRWPWIRLSQDRQIGFIKHDKLIAESAEDRLTPSNSLLHMLAYLDRHYPALKAQAR